MSSDVKTQNRSTVRYEPWQSQETCTFFIFQFLNYLCFYFLLPWERSLKRPHTNDQLSVCVYVWVCGCACVRVSGQPYLYRAERERVIDRWSEITVLSSAENSPPGPVSPPPPSSFSFHPITPSCYLSIKR